LPSEENAATGTQLQERRLARPLFGHERACRSATDEADTLLVLRRGEQSVGGEYDAGRHDCHYELAQNLRSIAYGLDWFDAMKDSEQVAVLEEIAGYCIQARAITDAVSEATRRAGLWPTYTPVVLAARRQLHAQLPKIAGLPSDERRKAFRLLIALLVVADERRRVVFCSTGCSHRWHRLSGLRTS
jgi:hypothetical protein